MNMRPIDKQEAVAGLVALVLLGGAWWFRLDWLATFVVVVSVLRCLSNLEVESED